ncbi:MAG: electron transfer flavoprotein subunit alpha/FixB family protein, partial [Candidatus Eisenbacteria bacterium]
MSILVFVEQRGGRIRSVSNEALGLASRLKGALGGEVVAILPCASDPGAGSLGAAGADKVRLAAHPGLGSYDPAGYTRAVVAAAEELEPALILFPASSLGKDLAPRVAARLGVGLAS